MWYPKTDFDRTFDVFQEFWKLFDTAPRTYGKVFDGASSLFESKDGYELRIDLPGLALEDLNLEIHEQTLTLSAKRELATREGYATHRLERRSFDWKRSFSLPEKVDTELVKAKFEDGLLTVSMGKQAEAKPRQIQVQVN